MALSKLFTNYSVKLHSDVLQESVAVYLDGISDLGLNLSLRTGLEVGDGNYFASFGALVSGGPVARATTVDLKAVLDQLGMSVQAIVADGSHPGVVLYWRKVAQGATRVANATAEHVSVTIANGLAVLRGISARHQETATARVEFVARQAGATAPLTFAETAALPANTPGADVTWTLGPVLLNATEVEGIESVDIDPGVALFVEGADSDIYPSFVAVRTIMPTVRLRTRHVDLSSVLGEDGAYYTAGQVVVYLKKKSEGGTFVGDATAEHLSFTLGKCRAELQSVEGDPKAMDILLTPWATIGTVDPITVDTTAALP